MTKRQSMDPPGHPMHRQPIPTVSRVGNMIFSANISGMDLATGEVPSEPERQIANAFANMKAAVEAAGGTLENIGKLSVSLKDRSMRDVVNKYWLESFPDEKSRPVRHTAGGPASPEFIVQLEFIAVL